LRMRSTARLHRIDVWGSAFLASLGLATGGCGGSVEDAPGGGSAGGGNVGAGTPGGLIPCESPSPILVDGEDSGFVLCDGYWKHRPESKTCPSSIPRADFACGVGSCSTDADCGGGPNAYCAVDSFDESCFCATGCATDADCGSGKVCECGDPVGSCMAAECTVDGDCEGGALCATVDTEPDCGAIVYVCQTPGDECASDNDCADNPNGSSCGTDGTKRVCVSGGCAIGRPFIVDGGERLAPTAARSDWAADVAPDLDALSARTKKKLGEYWTLIGQMEHASIAAFARFSLQLLALGAPPELLVRSQTAMADETHHARLAFALASAYLERPVGPGSLDMSGALGDISVEEALRTVIMEGCVGETVAAMEAKEALTYVTDPSLRYVFGEIARDESQHALLAWRAVGWLCEAFGGRALAVVGDVVDDLRAALSTMPAGEPDAHDESLLALGFVSDKVRGELRRGATERVVLRGLEAIVCGAGVDPDVESSRMTLV
jgi:hypothetical protein